MAKTAHIITIGYTRYYVESVSAATNIINALGKLKPCKFHYQEGDTEGAHYYPSEDESLKLELELNQPFRPRKKPLGLPKPKRGTRRCLCGHSDVAPGERCTSCDMPYPNA